MIKRAATLAVVLSIVTRAQDDDDDRAKSKKPKEKELDMKSCIDDNLEAVTACEEFVTEERKKLDAKGKKSTREEYLKWQRLGCVSEAKR